MLIGVTRFFRDREVFDVLAQKWMTEILTKAGNNEVRFWVAGCSTGEEAYSLAIMAREAMAQAEISRDVKIFATDIDKYALASAAKGLFPESIAADVPPELLSRYFFRADDRFQVARSIREMVVFAPHNLIKDPPFTRIDLISCRNLLIYLQPILQRKVMGFFNFSLNPQGLLLLGNSETIGDMESCFDTLDQKNRIFQTTGRNIGLTEIHGNFDHKPFQPGRPVRRVTPNNEESILEDTLAALEDDLPLTVVVNDQLEVLHVIGKTDGILKLPSGKLSSDISKLAVKELVTPLTTGISKVFRTNEPLRFSNIRLHQGDKTRTMHLRIKPLRRKKRQEPLVIVLLEESKSVVVDSDSMVQTFDLSQEAEQRISDLEQELQFFRENLQATVEELETSNEELQATNEELLASNEELQSTNEELQSTNEELFTVNAEHQARIMDLSELNSDVENLLSASQIGQLLLDDNLCVRRFSARISEFFNLLDTDVGRNLSHISHNLIDVDPIREIKAVRESNVMSERKVQTNDGKMLLMRVIPYFVGPQTFSGVLASFVEISGIMETEKSLLT
mgnify:CR=1 FL=1